MSPWYFDQRTAAAACEFFPRFLRFTKGEWAGRPFTLAPWQAHHTAQIFGWRRRSDDTRRYRRVRGWVPRKNGKSEWFAGIGHLLTVGDNEPGAEVYAHALDKSQASVLWDMAARMTTLSEPLSQLYEVTKTALFCPALMATFRPLSGEAYGKHGLSPHAIIGDEAHGWPDDRLHTFLRQGMGARRQPLDATISTAGEIKTYGHELFLESLAVIADPDADPEMYAFNYAADADADWTDPAVWAAANPNLGVSLKVADLESECRQAQKSTRLENDFRRYKLNQWVEQTRRWFPMQRWAENTRDAGDAELWRKLPQEMAGRPAYGGLDLGSTEDITALSWCFPPAHENERTTFVRRFWCPEATIAERDSPRTPYRKWAAEGALTATPGNVTDYDFIEHAVREDAARFDLRRADPEQKAIAIDRWNATQVAVHLESDGIPVALFGQGFASMAAPSKEIERLFLMGGLEHGNHPVARWMYGNATYREDPAGNIKPDKQRAAEKIDGVVADVMALGIASQARPQVDIGRMIDAGRMVV